jgi:hypothetical protein
MKTIPMKLVLCRIWLTRFLHRAEPETAAREKSKSKRTRHHGPTTFFEMP